MTVKSYPPPCRNFLQPFYLSVTLYACAQRDIAADKNANKTERRLTGSWNEKSQPTGSYTNLLKPA